MLFWVFVLHPVVVLSILVGIANKLQDFWSAHVSHVKRQSNKLAHILAKYAKEVENNDNCVELKAIHRIKSNNIIQN